MLAVEETVKFRRSLRRAVKRGKSGELLAALARALAAERPLPPKHRDHKLVGNYIGCRECHIEPDWLLIYRVDGDTLLLVDTGSHADLFG